MLFLVLAGCLLSEDSHAQDILANRAMRRYDVMTWPTSPAVSGVVSNWIPALSGDLLENSSVCTNREQTASFTSTMFEWEDSPSIEKLDLRFFVSSDFPSAKHALLMELGGMESTIPMSRGTNGLERLGDICYADLNQPAFVTFVRNNMFVSCCASLDETSLTNLLFSLDEQILASLKTNEHLQTSGVDIPDMPEPPEPNPE